jgi:CHASE2 domain-containing sensor protein
MAGDQYDAWKVILAAFGISSVGGLAALLRSNKPLTARTVAAAFLYSGMMGATIGLLWYNYFDGQGNIPFLLGISAMAGIGGTTLADFVIQFMRRGGLDISIRHKKEPIETGDDAATKEDGS